MAKVLKQNVFIVECFGDSGAWIEVVFANDQKTAINKAEIVYGRFHQKFKAYVRNEFDSYIE